MTTLLKNAKVVNVFTDTIEEKNVLIEDRKIAGVGSYDTADNIIDVSGKYICPSFIDGHIHIESSFLKPAEFAKACVPHGTGAVVADPHEIANVCGTAGIEYMLEASSSLPMHVCFTLPSCVPATGFDESGAELSAKELEPFYSTDRIIGLAEVMNYPGVIAKDEGVIGKIQRAKENRMIINGHAPMLSGKQLDKYIYAGIGDDHECSSLEEAEERIRKGQRVLIREGTSARNLEALSGLFDEPWNRRCMLVSDDKHPYDLITNGQIDASIRKAVGLGKNVLACIRMATIQAAEYFRMRNMGAVAPGYFADLLVLDDLESVKISEVYYDGRRVFSDGEMIPVNEPEVSAKLRKRVYSSFKIKKLTEHDFFVEPQEGDCRVIGVIPGELLTDERIRKLDFSKNNGIDTESGIIKLAVCERHNGTRHIGLGYAEGLGITKGAIASSVSHDSHNLIIAGANESDMALAGNTVAKMKGGLCVVLDGKVLEKFELPIAGLMSEQDAQSVCEGNRKVREAAAQLGSAEGVEPFMNLAFISLSVIPDIKMTTHGLVDVNRQKLIPLFVGNDKK